MGNMITDPPSVDRYKHDYLSQQRMPEIPSEESTPWKEIHVYHHAADATSLMIHHHARSRVEGGFLIVEEESGVITGYATGGGMSFKVYPSETTT